MSRRRIRALTLIFLGLLIAAPLSSGDKGLWLSLISTPAHILSIGTDSVPAEHAIVVPERAGRAARSIVAPGSERANTSGGIGVPRAAWSVGSGTRWTIPAAASVHPHGETFADRPAPRAPPG